MRPLRLRIIALMFLSSSMSALAADVVSEVCYSPEQSSVSATPPSNTTVFTCPITGANTIGQLAALGMRVVQLTPVIGSSASMLRQQLVVQRGIRIHASGFE